MVGRGPDGRAVATQLQAFSGGVSKSERALVAGTDGSTAEVEEKITQAVKTFGLAPGAQKMMDAERLAAEEAVRTGLYGVWRNPTSGHDFCGRIGPLSRCFCGHDYSEHVWDKAKKKMRPKCGSCQCTGFQYMPRRPEEVGEWWLPRRRGFDVRLWRAKCKCGHSHEDHDPNRLSCRSCACSHFQSAWVCTVCEGKWEDHESLWETEQERHAEGRPIGQAFFPLSTTPQIQDVAFNPSASSSEGGPRSSSLPHRPRPERSVKLMQERCPHYGGAGRSSSSRPGSDGGQAATGFGSLEDAFPSQQPRGLGSLEDAFPPAASRGSAAALLSGRRSGPSSGRDSPLGAAGSAVARGPAATRAISDVAAAAPRRGRPPSGQRPPSGGSRP